MTDLARQVWPALAIALVLGLAFGWWSRAARTALWPGRLALGLLVVALAALGLLAALDLVPGRAGLWLDSALLHLAAYLVGCVLGWAAALRIRSAQPNSSQ